uniref:Uncharacterized protein n=1 Tax=Globodera rostochiensis TaxID=31243 RepID=A0A914H5X7_GLORO
MNVLNLLMHNGEETNIAEIFNKCTDNCKSKYSKFISDEWPAQRVPFCIYIQRSSNDITTLKKITLNNYSWKIERQDEMSIDVLNDRALTLFLIDCPIFKPHGNFFEIRTSTEPWAFMRVVELVKQKITIKSEEKNWIEKLEIGEHLLLADVENPLARFILLGRQFCSKLVLEAHQFTALFELIEEYKYAANLQFAIPSVDLFVPSFSWHRRQFVEGTLCQMFHSSQKLSALVHQFGNFNEFSTTANLAVKRCVDICGSDICGPEICGPDICGLRQNVHLRPDICGQTFAAQTFATRLLRSDTCGLSTIDICGQTFAAQSFEA